VSRVLASEIYNGDSVGDVAKHFRSHHLITPDDEQLSQSIRDVWGQHGDWSIEDSDQFFHFAVPGAGANLQFRKGKLVNLQNSAYRDARKLAQLNGYSLPNPLLKFGIMPYYLPFAIGTILVCMRQSSAINRRQCDLA
jgi:hypothetical protein